MVSDIDKRINNTLILSLGGNIGDVEACFKRALEEISVKLGKVEKQSSIYKTAAWGNENQPDFLNQVIIVSTDNSPIYCLQKLLEIEAKLGRIRVEKWGERIIDIDILFYNQEVINTPNLIVPHPLIQERNFILMPLSEVTTQLVHPVMNKSIKTLREECKDKLIVKKQS